MSLETKLYTVAPEEGFRNCFESDFDESKPRFKPIFIKHYDWIKELDDEERARPCILDNVQKAILCKTPFLGFDSFECPNPNCNEFLCLYRHCHSRFCSSCGVKLQKVLATKAEVMCINAKHRHMVFTIPKEYREILRRDRRLLNVLFIASRNVICKEVNKSLFNKLKRKRGIVANDSDSYYFLRNYKQANDFGMIATLHTFGRDLKWNPHIHALIPELIYDPVKDEIKYFKHFNFESLRKSWMYEVNRLLKKYLNGFGTDKVKLDEINNLVDKSYKKQINGFYVYAKYDLRNDDKYTSKVKSKNIKSCVNYMMRYAGRPVMAESRLVTYNFENDTVEWYYEDHKTSERIDVLETGKDLLSKMIIHIPDENFRMIRYYGFYNNKCQDTLDKVHTLLGIKKNRPSLNKAQRKEEVKKKLNKLKFRTHLIDTYNKDILKCKCGSTLVYDYTYNPLEGRINDRNFRQESIDEMFRLRLHRRS